MVHPEGGRGIRARMEDVLDLYVEEPNEQRPVVCFDETPAAHRRIAGAVRAGRAGRARRLRVRAQRHGERLRVCRCAPPLAPREGDRPPRGADFAHCMRDLVDLHYPQAERIRAVMDNLSTHCLPRSNETTNLQ